jgi:DNA-binding transcriptional regulator YdaS (Cro superfamily)
MGQSATVTAPVSMRAAISKATDAHPYAKALKNCTPGTVKRVLADDPICTPEKDAFARAIKFIGGINATIARVGISDFYLLEIIYGGETPDPTTCHDVEKACGGQVMCEDMRSGLIWFRDPSGDVVGYAEAIEATQLDLKTAIANFGTSFSSEQAAARLKASNDERPLGLAGHWDLVRKSVDGLGGVNAFAKLSGFDSEYIQRVIDGVDIGSMEMCWEIEKATGTSCDDLRGDLFVIRDDVGSVVGHATELQDGIRHQEFMRASVRKALASTPAADGVSEALVALFGTSSNGAWWRNVALTSWSEEVLKRGDDRTLQTVENSCENLLFTIEHGVAATNKLIWAALQSGWADNADIGNTAALLGCVSEYAIELRELKSNIQYQLKERAA